MTALLPSNIARARWVVLACYYGLFLYFGVLSTLSLENIVVATLVIWLIQITPLLIFAYGLHKNHMRTYAWLSFVVLLYFMHGVLLAFDPERRWFGIVEVALSSLLFIFLIVVIRLYREHFQVGL